MTPRPRLRDELITITRMLMGLPQAVKGELPAPAPPAEAVAAEPPAADDTEG